MPVAREYVAQLLFPAAASRRATTKRAATRQMKPIPAAVKCSMPCQLASAGSDRTRR